MSESILHMGHMCVCVCVCASVSDLCTYRQLQNHMAAHRDGRDS